MHDRDLRRKIGQEQRLLDRGIAAADHDHFLVAVEEAVAGRAGRHAVALEFLFGRQIEPARLRAGGDDQGIGEIDVAGIAGQPERPLRQLHLVDVVGDDAGADMLGLRLHLLHQPGPLDDVGEARIVLDVGGDGELAAGLDALNQDRLQHGARRVDRSGVARRTRADDHDLGVGGLCHGLRPPGWASVGRCRPRRPDTGRLLLPMLDVWLSPELCKIRNPADPQTWLMPAAVAGRCAILFREIIFRGMDVLVSSISEGRVPCPPVSTPSTGRS